MRVGAKKVQEELLQRGITTERSQYLPEEYLKACQASRL